MKSLMYTIYGFNLSDNLKV